MIKTAINDGTIAPKTCKEKLADTLKRNVQSSKRMTYTKMNPSFSQHKVYDNENIPEYMRVSFTKFRLFSHELNIERGDGLEYQEKIGNAFVIRIKYKQKNTSY